MELVVDYNKIKDIGDQVLNKNEELTSTLSEIIKIIYELSNGWSGPDCENFQIVSITYIKNLEKITNRIQYIGEFLKKASSNYQEFDTGWKSTMQEVGDTNYE